MEARAIRKHIPGAPRKMRRVVNLIRKQSVSEALSVLHFLPHAATRPIALTIRSAVHNLMDQNPDMRFDESRLFIKEIRVDEGPVLKRRRPVSRGRSHPILKRRSHLSVTVASHIK